MKSVLISIQPQWCELIASGKKTVEVRKTRPKIETPFKVYIYETKESKRRFLDHRFNSEINGISHHTEMGKVIGEFVCDEINRIAHCGTCRNDIRLKIVDKNLNYKELSDNYLSKCKLSYYELDEYSTGSDVYGWNISNLVIYDKPKELSEFKKINRECWYADLGIAKRDCPECQNKGCFVQRPPQSWCYVEGCVNE